MKKYWQILRKYKISLAVSPLLVLITVLCETIQPTFMADIIDNGVMPRDLGVITRIGTYMVIVSLTGLLFSVLNVWVSSRAAIGFGTDLRGDLFRHIQALSFSDVDRFGSASLITRLTSDISRIQQIVLLAMRLMLRSPLLLIMALFFVIRLNPSLALILAGAIPLLSISLYFILRKGFPYFVKVQQKLDSLNEVVRENLINIRVVKSFVREKYETRKFEEKSEDLSATVIKASNIIVSIFPLMQLIMNLSILVILWAGGYKVMTGQLKVGELISFVNYLAQILMSLMMLSMIIMSVARASASSGRILEVFAARPSLVNTPEGLRHNYKIEQGEIRFDHVYFRYAGSENDVLHDVSFHVRPGETVAVVGATGSAKSSLVQLIPRLYDVSGGTLLIDEVPVKAYKLDELHRRIGVVLQKNELFTGTIRDNLKWGNPQASDRELAEAVRAAEAAEFIERFPDGYETWLGRGGVNLSGGQKQRLCIARALLRKPKILILDDSTSAVDSETELKIQHNLKTLLGATTVLIVTQRISTMQSADRVIVLDEGEINAVGTPAQLMQTSAVYREIYHSQQLID